MFTGRTHLLLRNRWNILNRSFQGFYGDITWLIRYTQSRLFSCTFYIIFCISQENMNVWICLKTYCSVQSFMREQCDLVSNWDIILSCLVHFWFCPTFSSFFSSCFLNNELKPEQIKPRGISCAKIHFWKKAASWENSLFSHQAAVHTVLICWKCLNVLDVVS